jgi:hypothetical protein
MKTNIIKELKAMNGVEVRKKRGKEVYEIKFKHLVKTFIVENSKLYPAKIYIDEESNTLCYNKADDKAYNNVEKLLSSFVI